MGVVALLIQEQTGGKNIFVLTRYPLTVSQGIPLAKLYYQHVRSLLPQLLPGPTTDPPTEGANDAVGSEGVITNSWSVVLGESLPVTEEEEEQHTVVEDEVSAAGGAGGGGGVGGLSGAGGMGGGGSDIVASGGIGTVGSVIGGSPLGGGVGGGASGGSGAAGSAGGIVGLGERQEGDGLIQVEPDEASARYRAHYTVLGDVTVAAIASIQSNPFEASLCLRRMKRVLVTACKNGTDGLVTSKELQKSYGEVFFALERILDGDEGMTVFSTRLQEVQPHSTETSHEAGRIAVLNATKTWKEAQEEYEQYLKLMEKTTAVEVKAFDPDNKGDSKTHISFDSSWSAPQLKARSNEWTEISYGKNSKGHLRMASEGGSLIGNAKESKAGRSKKEKEKEKDKVKGSKRKGKKDKEDKKDKSKTKSKTGKHRSTKSESKGKKEKKARKEEGNENSGGKGDSDKLPSPTSGDKGDALLKKKKVLGDAQRKLSIGMGRRGTQEN